MVSYYRLIISLIYMPEYNFTKFEGVGNKYEDRISITKSQFIGFPRVFCQTYGVKELTHAELFFDNEKNAIAVRFHKEKVADSYKVNYSANPEGATISARSFFKSNHIDTNRVSGKYQAKVYEDPTLGTLYVIELASHEPTH